MIAGECALELAAAKVIATRGIEIYCIQHFSRRPQVSPTRGERPDGADWSGHTDGDGACGAPGARTGPAGVGPPPRRAPRAARPGPPRPRRTGPAPRHPQPDP